MEVLFEQFYDNLDACVTDPRRIGIYIPQGEPTPVDYDYPKEGRTV
jgi:hypothetical protein